MLWQYWVFFLPLLSFLLLWSGRRWMNWFGRHFSKRLIVFSGLNRNLINRRTFRTFNKITHSKAKSNFVLTIATDHNTIKRKTLIHILTSTTDENLTIPRNQLNNSTKITSGLPTVTIHLHHGQTWSYFLLLRHTLGRHIVWFGKWLPTNLASHLLVLTELIGIEHGSGLFILVFNLWFRRAKLSSLWVKMKYISMRISWTYFGY